MVLDCPHAYPELSGDLAARCANQFPKLMSGIVMAIIMARHEQAGGGRGTVAVGDKT